MTWHIRDSENHHVQKSSALWQFLLILTRYGRGDEILAKGGTVKEHLQAWTDFFTTWMKERSSKSMFVEIQSLVYGVHTMKNVYPLYDFAPTPELKKLTENFITLFWTLWAQEQINGVQGGGQSRVYPDTAVTSASEALLWAWYYSGIGEFHTPEEMEYILLDCGYRMPQLVIDMIHNPIKRGTYTIESRPFGAAAPDDVPLEYRPRTDWGHIYRYSYCTPDYILGTLMCPQLTPKDWCLISSQNRFQGVTFNQMNAMILPIPESEDLHTLQATVPTVGFNQFWSQQADGTLITQRCTTYTAPMCIFFSGAGNVRANVTEKDGWYFTYCGNAYAAVKICQGSFTWEDHPFAPGQWMRCDVPTTPVIVETGNQERFGSFESFQEAVCKLAPTWDGPAMKYHSLYGHHFAFVTDGDSKDSTIDGEYYVKKPDFAYKSPFINGKWGGDEVKITFDGQEILLKF